MPKAGFPIVFRLTQAEVDSGVATPLSGGFIEIVDGNNSPTGTIYNTGPAGVAPATIASTADVQQAVSASLKKVQLPGGGTAALTYALHNGAEVHAEAGITGCSMALTAFQVSTVQQTGSFWLFNYTGTNLPLTLGAGWSGGISEDGDTTNDINGAGTLVTIPHARKVLVIFDADGWVRATLLGVEVTQSELDVVAAVAATKADADSVARVHGQVFTTTPTLCHPINFAATTATGTDGTYTVTQSSAFDTTTYPGWKAFDGVDTTDWATAGVITNFWVRLQLPVKKIVTRAILRGRNSGTEAPTSWRIEASNDGTVWTSLLAATTTLNATAQTFDFTNTLAYTYYRLFCVTGAASNPGLSRMELHEGVPAVAAATTTAAGLMSASDKTKLNGVATGAEVNVNADWTAASGDAQVLNKPTLGTSAALDVPASGNAATGEVVKGSDTRLTDSRAPTTHTHAQSDVTSLATDLAAKVTKAGDTMTGVLNVQATVTGEATAIVSAKHTNLTQGVDIGYNTISASGSVTNQDLKLAAKGTGTVQAGGSQVITRSLVVNDLTTTTTDVPLSAAQGKALQDGKQAALSAAQTDAINKIQVVSTRTIPTFTAATTSGTLGNYIASASSEFSATYAAWKACQAAAGDWATLGVTTNFWIRLQLPSAKVVTTIRVAARTTGLESPQTGWRLEGSNDGTTFTTLYTGVATMPSTPTDYAVSNTTAYTYYRIFCPTGSGTNPGMSVFWLYENAYSLPTVTV